VTEKLSEETIQAWARLIRVEQQLLEKVEGDLKRAGLPPLVWYDALLELVRVPSGRLRYRELHAKMLLAKHNLSRLIDRLETDRLVVREPVEDDARGAYVAITQAGRDMQKRMWPAYRHAIAQHFACKLSRNDARQLSRILNKLRGPTPNER
jgi:DNA-binding MarR family transcriptional regulator